MLRTSLLLAGLFVITSVASHAAVAPRGRPARTRLAPRPAQPLRTPPATHRPTALPPVASAPLPAPTATRPPLPSRLELKLSAEWSGPDIQRFSNLAPNRETRQLNPRDPVRLDHSFQAGYRFGEQRAWSLGAATVFSVIPIVTGTQQAFVIRDPFIYIRGNPLVQTANFTFVIEQRTYFGLAESSQLDNIWGGGRLIEDLLYIFDKGPWFTGLYAYEHANVIGLARKGQTDGKVYLMPYGGAMLSPSLALVLAYENMFVHRVGDGFYMRSTQATLNPGFDWTIAKGVDVWPYLKLPVADQLTLDTTTVGAAFVWKIQ